MQSTLAVAAPSAPPATHSLTESSRAAWDASFLSSLPRHIAAAILADAREVSVPAGQTLYGGTRSESGAAPALVLSGLVRIAASVPQGRELTISHASAGAVIGLAELVLGTVTATSRSVSECSIKAETLQESRLLQLSPQRFHRLISEDAHAAMAVARYLALENGTTQQLMVRGVLQPVRDRVAHHLLDIAVRDGRQLVARTTHQEIANAVGSVREVVSRVLRSMQGQQLVRQEGGRLVLVDAARLVHDARAVPVVPATRTTIPSSSGRTSS